MLYIVATPIGNLEDISLRALETLRKSDAILCEDTRRTSILLNRYGIDKPLISYHKFKEAEKLERILSDLSSGKVLSLVSDAGTPCINDPGSRLVAACRERTIPLSTIPGPRSLINALVLTGFQVERFQFVGFLPKQAAKTLKELLFFPGVSIAFESPERLLNTLKALEKLAPNRSLAVAREMTKTFEECRTGKAKELINHFSAKPPKGEIVLVIDSGEPPELPLDLEECVDLLRKVHGMTLKEAIKYSARFLKMPKSAVYKQVHDR